MEEINESGAAPEESKNQTGTGGIRKKAKHLARKTAEDWTARDVGTYASNIAFFFFMSMIPLLIIIFQLLPIFGLSQVDLIKFLDRLMPEAMQGFAAIVVRTSFTSRRHVFFCVIRFSFSRQIYSVMTFLPAFLFAGLFPQADR